MCATVNVKHTCTHNNKQTYKQAMHPPHTPVNWKEPSQRQAEKQCYSEQSDACYSIADWHQHTHHVSLPPPLLTSQYTCHFLSSSLPSFFSFVIVSSSAMSLGSQKKSLPSTRHPTHNTPSRSLTQPRGPSTRDQLCTTAPRRSAPTNLKQSSASQPPMACCFCGADNDSADNAFLCEYYGVLPALVPLDGEGTSPTAASSTGIEDRIQKLPALPSNSLFALSWSRSLPQLFETNGAPPPPPGTVRVVIISDTHERHHDMNIPPGDVLLHGGDILEGLSILRNPGKALEDFFAWFNALPHAVKVVIGGNHDQALAKMDKAVIRSMAAPALYLEDESALVEPIGLRIFGSPRSEANSSFSPNSAYQGKKWWKPIPAPLDSATAREGHDNGAARPQTLPASAPLTIHLEGTQPAGPIDVLLTHQSLEFGSPAEVARQKITQFVMDAAPRRLHCAGHLHLSHGLHKPPVPPCIKEHYGFREAASTDADGSEKSSKTVSIPFLPSINAAMLVCSRGHNVLQRPCVVDIEL